LALLNLILEERLMPHRFLRVGDRICTASCIHPFEALTRVEFDREPVNDGFNPTRIGVASTETGLSFLLRSDGEVRIVVAFGFTRVETPRE
jgi:hypothetical protein